MTPFASTMVGAGIILVMGLAWIGAIVLVWKKRWDAQWEEKEE